MLTAGCLSASAQEADTKEVFNPHWYIQAQGGIQNTLGEVKAKDLISGNAQIAAGYKFTSVWGARLTVGAWQSKAGLTLNDVDYKWKWNYVAPTVDVTVDLLNAFCGYKPRVVSLGLFAGVGCNIGFNNDEAAATKAQILKSSIVGEGDNAVQLLQPNEVMEYQWDGSKARMVGQFGVNVDFNISKRVSLGLEASANVIGDRYNSKKAKNADWYFNTLAGVKVALGKTSKRVPVEKVAPEIIEREKVIEKIRHDTIYITTPATNTNAVAAKADTLRRDIFYTIRGSQISQKEMHKIEDIVAYLKKYPEAKVTVTGYADKGTGNSKINYTYAKKRAEVVSRILTTKFGIKKNRIIVESKGDTVQPYAENDKNRVTICIAE